MITAIDNNLAILPKRDKTSNKGDYGHVLIVGGDHGMMGAPLMAGLAALRVGAGLVSIATQPEHALLLTEKRPELMSHGITTIADLQPLLVKADVIAIGPGLGQSDWSRSLFNAVIKSDKPLVVDADALNLLSQQPQQNDNWILTPHPGEAARLLAIDVTAVQSDRETAIKTLQQHYAGVVVLKGAETLVTNGEDIKICQAGNPGMATAGMGDVLTGLIAGLCGQFHDLFQSAQRAVLMHALAGDKAVQVKTEAGLIATDILDYLYE